MQRKSHRNPRPRRTLARRFALLVLTTAVLTGPSMVIAQDIERLADIQSAVNDFVAASTVGDATEITVGRLDPRLRLPRCDTRYAVDFAPGSAALGHSTVGVKCEGTKPWSLYVPVTVKKRLSMVVSVTALTRGHVLQAQDLRREQRLVVNQRAGYFGAVAELVGQVLTRDINAGTQLNRVLVKPQRLVKRGEEVTLALERGSVAIQMTGTALRDGALGEQIPVRNASSKRVVEGEVAARGLVLVTSRREVH